MKTTIEIQNLKCGGCGNTITKKLSALKNITDISVDVENSTISYSHETDDAFEIIKKELAKLGYPILGERNLLDKKIRSYVSCAIGKMN